MKTSMKLPATWHLPVTIRNRLGKETVGKQRAMVADEHLLLVLHKAPQPGDRTRQSVFFWRRPDGQWESSGGRPGLEPLNQHLRQYDQAIAQLRKRYDHSEHSEDYFQLLTAIAPLRLATKNLHTTLQTAREGISHDRDIIGLRDWAYEMERNLDLLQENTKNALDFQIAQRAEAQIQLSNESIRVSNRLNVLAAIFYPLTAISCVFGMNLTSGLEGGTAITFWGVTAAAIGLGFGVRNWVVRGRWRG